MSERAQRKVRTGVVVSNSMDKTVVVRVGRTERHRIYGKIFRKSGKLYAHDEANQAGVGDLVKLIESRPLSKTKRWRVVEILERAK